MKRLALSLSVVYLLALAGSAANVAWAGRATFPFMRTLLTQLPIHLPRADCIDTESTHDARMETLRESFQAAYADAFPELIRGQALDDTVRIPEGDRADVVIFVLESLRHNALDPQTMPMLCELAQTGLVCRQHYAGANASHFGLFSLLYGRSALVYEPTLDARIPPQLCATLRESGYELSFVSSGNCDEWRRMGEYLNDSIFDRLETIEQGTWVERDRATLRRVAEIVADGQRPPQFVVAFLMSTHFNYEFPPEFAVHEPYARNVSLFTLGEREGLWNRYRNAAGFLDDEVARTIGELDLDRTVVVVTGDHGESLLDDGQMFHGSRLSEIQTRVPCVLLGAGVPRGTTGVMTSHVDLAPTLIDLLRGTPAPIAHCHGCSVLSPEPDRPRNVLLVQPPFGTQRDPEFGHVAIFTENLRAQCRLSLREPAVLDVKLIDERGQTRRSHRMTDQELGELQGAFRERMESIRSGGGCNPRSITTSLDRMAASRF